MTGVPDYKVKLNELGHMIGFDVVPMEIKHDDLDVVAHAGNGVPDYKVELDDLGHMVGFTLVGSAVHSDEDKDFLEHYGIKGMRWGVRRETGSNGRVDATPVTVTQPKPGSRLTATGGQNHPAHEDATKAVAARQKARASTLAALSNDELQATVKRMQLEQQYSDLMNKRQGKSAAKKGQEIVKGLLGMGKTANEVMAFHNSPAGKELRKTLEKATGSKAA
jgi:hypothetical protein